DKVIIAAFAGIDADKARQHAPTVVLLDDHNEIKRPV
ncbi:MAG TPA: aspartate 1-decarboxylase, partial [Hyphomonas sp.]|nr:aspartate 1-decarboxylase [Hyphomonas sp.]